jgi:hypothetical protein
MESLIKSIAPYLAPIDLILIVIIGWQFVSAWKREKVVAAAFANKDDKLVSLFSVLNTHTDAIQRLLGFLDGQRRSQ